MQTISVSAAVSKCNEICFFLQINKKYVNIIRFYHYYRANKHGLCQIPNQLFSINKTKQIIKVTHLPVHIELVVFLNNVLLLRFQTQMCPR